MPSFDYKGYSPQGKTLKGVVEADNIKHARVKLKRDGISVFEIRDRKSAPKKSAVASMRGKVSVEDLALATRQLATLVKAQIPLVDCVAALVDQVENESLKVAFSDIKQMVNEGSSFHKALGKYPKIFDVIYISMAEAGESTGTLDTILIRLAEFKEKQYELASRVKSAMMYPIFMLIFGAGVMTAIFMYVIPQVSQIFLDMGTTLPWYTQFLIDVSQFMADYYLIIFGSIAGAITMFLRWKTTEAGRYKWDGVKMNIPIFGKLNRMIAVSRFSQTLAALLKGGVPMLKAFDIVKNVVDNKVFEKVILEARDNVSEGESIAAPLKRSGEFPPLVIHMIGIGEKTGELENLLGQVAEAYDFQVENSIDGLTSLLGPIMVVVMGGMIGFVVFSILVPIFQLSGSLGT